MAKILWGCSFGCNHLLNFNLHTMKIHNCHHANVHELEFSVETGILLQNKQFKSNVCERITANIEFWESWWKSIINNYSLLINNYYKMLLWKSRKFKSKLQSIYCRLWKKSTVRLPSSIKDDNGKVNSEFCWFQPIWGGNRGVLVRAPDFRTMFEPNTRSHYLRQKLWKGTGESFISPLVQWLIWEYNYWSHAPIISNYSRWIVLDSVPAMSNRTRCNGIVVIELVSSRCRSWH